MKKWKEQKNFIVAASLLAVIYGVFAFFFDFYYDLNDDVLIKDMLEGCVSGTPSGYNNQMLYPISFCISLPYHLTASIPWFAIFLCGCQFTAVCLILARIFTIVEKKTEKKQLKLQLVAGGITTGLLFMVMMLWETVYVQYTVTCGLLVAAACFLTATNAVLEKDSVKDEIPSIILLFLAMNIRSEMFLLCCPLIACTGMILWSDAGKESRKNGTDAKKVQWHYGALVGSILLLFLTSLFLDSLAYHEDAWKEYRDFFDARTKVYDYTWYPDYQEAEDFYQENGISKTQVDLIAHYNFGLDETIDASTLWSIADYAKESDLEEPLINRLQTAFKEYVWRSTHREDAPYNFMVGILYVLLVLVYLRRKDFSIFYKVPLLWFFRTIPWMYVIISKRVPERISHPLYFIEAMILVAFLLKKMIEGEKEKKAEGVCLLLFSICLLSFVPGTVQKVAEEQSRRETVNQQIELFDAFAKNHSTNYYYLDVYSTVNFSEKMFADRRPGFKNYSILGGWGFGSPLLEEGLEEYLYEEAEGQSSAVKTEEQLLQDHFYFVADKKEDFAYIIDFYKEKKKQVSLKPVAELEDWMVYHFDEAK